MIGGIRCMLRYDTRQNCTGQHSSSVQGEAIWLLCFKYMIDACQSD